MKRRWGAGVIIVLLAAGGALYFRETKGSVAENGVYTTVTVARGEIVTTITSTGTLEPVSTVDVGTQVSGNINALYVDFNDTVTEGQVIAELDRTFLLGALDEALASRNRAQAQCVQAESEFTRNRPLYEKGFISEQEYTRLKTDFKTQEAVLQSAEASVKKARINLRYATITSPITGTVIERNIEEGQTVAASFSAPTLFVIAEDLRRMEILASVDEADIGGIRKGQEVRFTVQAYPDSTFTGEVDQVRLQPTVTQNVVTYTVVIATENRNGVLLPGMTATVHFITEKAADVLYVPNSALRFTPEGINALTDIPGKRHSEKKRGGHGSGRVTARKTGRRTTKKDADTEQEKQCVVWKITDADKLEPVPVYVGLTDGKNTAVVSRALLAEGMSIVTGYGTSNTKKKRSVSLFPQPQRRRHR